MLHLTTLDATTYKLLQEIFRTEIIKNKFALAGGTSLALQIGHRKSIDLDLFSIEPFDVKELEIVLATNQNFSFEYKGSNSRMLFSSINNIKCDFVQEPSSLLDPFIVEDEIKYFSVKDIAAMKFHTICGRGKKKDFFDVYALLQLSNKDTLLNWFSEKYDATQLYFFWRSILYFDDAENDPDINGIPPFKKNWQEIKEFITATFSS
jgi:predicted nucleotidyltransferase component of viral defense system